MPRQYAWDTVFEADGHGCILESRESVMQPMQLWIPRNMCPLPLPAFRPAESAGTGDGRSTAFQGMVGSGRSAASLTGKTGTGRALTCPLDQEPLPYKGPMSSDGSS